MAVRSGADKQRVEEPYNRVSFSNNRELPEHCAEWKGPDTEATYTVVRLCEMPQVPQICRDRSGKWLLTGYRNLFGGGDELFWKEIVLMVVQPWEYIRKTTALYTWEGWSLWRELCIKNGANKVWVQEVGWSGSFYFLYVCVCLMYWTYYFRRWEKIKAKKKQSFPKGLG